MIATDFFYLSGFRFGTDQKFTSVTVVIDVVKMMFQKTLIVAIFSLSVKCGFAAICSQAASNLTLGTDLGCKIPQKSYSSGE